MSTHPSDGARPGSRRRTALIVLAVLVAIALFGVVHLLFPPGG